VSAHPNDLPEREGRLKDGRAIRVRHGRAGDEAGIARVVAASFAVYPRAARGRPDRAVLSLAQEIWPPQFVVATLADGGLLVGASCISGRSRSGLGRFEQLRRKLGGWGVYGFLCFALENVRRRLFEAVPGARAGQLYRYLDAVDPDYRSLGVGRHVADFVEDYARAAGHPAVWAMHRADNRPVLELHRKRGCTLVANPPSSLGRWFGHPGMIVSTRDL
jgi:GNAT superfamily N-acetyltransferase